MKTLKGEKNSKSIQEKVEKKIFTKQKCCPPHFSPFLLRRNNSDQQGIEKNSPRWC